MSNKANKGALTWSDIQLINGWSVYGTRAFQYAITDFGNVHIFGTIKKDSIPAAGEIVAVIPEGFRAKLVSVFPTMLITYAGFIITAFILDANGNLRIHPNETQANLDGYHISSGTNINYSYPAQ